MSENFILDFKCPEHIVDGLVDYYYSHKHEHTPGASAFAANNKPMISQVDKTIKDSMDLYCYFPYLQENEVFFNYGVQLDHCIESYKAKFDQVINLHKFGACEPFVIQKYEKGGGFHKEHFERSGGNNITIKRVLFWITYLDDVPDGGTTFRYLNHTEAAVKGKTIISPCDWTHTHCGQISHTQTKMIATGWLSHLWDFQY
mgnify:FL=1